MAIEIVDLPIKKGDFPVRYVNIYQRVSKWKDLQIGKAARFFMAALPICRRWSDRSKVKIGCCKDKTFLEEVLGNPIL